MDEKQRLRFPIKSAYAFGRAHGLEREVSDLRGMEIKWDSYTTSLRAGYLVGLFEQHGVFDEFKSKYWELGNTAEGEREQRRLRRIKDQYGAFLAGPAREPPREEESGELLFPLEGHLRDFIVANIGSIPLRGFKLHLYVDASGRKGVEYPTDVGPVDVLAEDSEGGFVVFELKLGKGPDRAVGQALRYMGWVSKHLAAGKKVSGVIVAHEIDEKLKYAVSVAPNITVFEYKVRRLEPS